MEDLKRSARSRGNPKNYLAGRTRPSKGVKENKDLDFFQHSSVAQIFEPERNQEENRATSIPLPESRLRFAQLQI